MSLLNESRRLPYPVRSGPWWQPGVEGGGNLEGRWVSFAPTDHTSTPLGLLVTCSWTPYFHDAYAPSSTGP